MILVTQNIFLYEGQEGTKVTCGDRMASECACSRQWSALAGSVSAVKEKTHRIHRDSLYKSFVNV